MKKLLFTLIFSFGLIQAQNLVKDPLFREITAPPAGLTQPGDDLPTVHWEISSGTPDIYHALATGTDVAAPCNWLGCVSGESYAGLHNSPGVTEEEIQTYFDQPYTGTVRIRMGLRSADHRWLSNVAGTYIWIGDQVIQTGVIRDTTWIEFDTIVDVSNATGLRIGSGYGMEPTGNAGMTQYIFISMVRVEPFIATSVQQAAPHNPEPEGVIDLSGISLYYRGSRKWIINGN